MIPRGIICLVGGGFDNSSEQLNKPEDIAVDIIRGEFMLRIQETPEFRY